MIPMLLGVGRDDFIESYASKTLLQATTTNTFSFDFLKSQDILYKSAAEKIKLVKCGDRVDLPMLNSGQIDLGGIWRYFHEGYTIVIDSLHRVDFRIAEVCLALALETGHRVQANAYISPAGGSGFATHYDTHDVIVVQTEGAKDWSIYEPTDEIDKFPNKFDSDRDPTLMEKGEMSAIRMRLGDSLYIPSGWPHSATAVSDKPSIHITFGLSRISMAEVLSMAMHMLAEGNEKLRRQASWNIFYNDGLELNELDLMADTISDLSTSRIVSQLRKSLFRDIRPDAFPAINIRSSSQFGVHLFKFCQITKTKDGVLVDSGFKIAEFAGPLADIILRIHSESLTIQELLDSFKDSEVLEAFQLLSEIGALSLTSNS